VENLPKTALEPHEVFPAVETPPAEATFARFNSPKRSGRALEPDCEEAAMFCSIVDNWDPQHFRTSELPLLTSVVGAFTLIGLSGSHCFHHV
jgi:hypothetical protein